MKTWQKYRNLAIRAKSIDLYEQMKIFLIRWSKLIRFLIIVTLSTIKGREGAVTLTLVRGEQRGDSGDTCWYPPPLIYVSSGDIVSDVSPLPQFLDNRVVLLPIWKLPLAGAPAPAAISDKCYCLWDQGRARGDFHCLSSKMFHVWDPGQNMKKPSSPFRHCLQH